MKVVSNPRTEHKMIELIKTCLSNTLESQKVKMNKKEAEFLREFDRKPVLY